MTHVRSGLLVVCLAIVAVACGGGAASSVSGGSPGPASATASAGATAPAGATPTGPANPSAPASNPPATGGTGGGSRAATVDLTFTGARAFTVSGQKGVCSRITKSDGTVELTVSLGASDAREIGQGFSLTNAFNFVDLKWVPDASGGYGRPGPADPDGGTWTISADVTTFTVDSDLAVFKPVDGPGPGDPEHLQGSITCP